MFTNWLSKTRVLQEDYYEVNFGSLRRRPHDLADYLMFNLFAAHDEISEVSNEIGWKPWSKTRGWFHKEKVTNEIVDVLHFLANVANACGISDEEMTAAYAAKMDENKRRQMEGYEQRGK